MLTIIKYVFSYSSLLTHFPILKLVFCRLCSIFAASLID